MSKYKVNIAGLSPAENAQIAAALASGQSVTFFPDEAEDTGESKPVPCEIVEGDEDGMHGEDSSLDLDIDWGDGFTPDNAAPASDNPFSFW